MAVVNKARSTREKFSMTDLQSSLFVIGGTIIVGVISYNKWQEYKARKSVERAFSSSQDDVLMAPPTDSPERPERHEPVLFEPESTSGPLTAADIPQDNIEM